MAKNEVEIVVTADDKASGPLRGISGALGSIGRVATGAALAGITAIGVGFGVAVREGIQMNASLEQSTMMFTTLMGDAQAAEEHVRSLFEFAAKTPFNTAEIIQASKHFQVFGGEALNSMENLTLVGDAAAAVGAPFDEVAFWVGRAYSAIQGGQPFGEAAMRLQELGLLTPEVRAEMEALQETGADASAVWGAFEGQMGSFTGAMELQSQSWNGLMETVKDNLQMAAATAMKPFFDIAKDGLSSLAVWLSSPEVQQGIQDLAQGLATLAQKLGEFVTGSVIPFVQEHGEQLKTVLIALSARILATVIPAIVSLVVSMAPVLLVIGAVIAIVALLRAAWEENWGGIQEKTASALAFIQNLIQTVLAGIQAFWQAHGAEIMAIAQKAWDTIRIVVTTIIEGISLLVQTILAGIQQFWQSHGEGITQIAQWAWDSIMTIINTVLDNIQLIAKGFMALFKGDWETFKQNIIQAWRNTWDAVVQIISNLWSMIQPWLTSLWSSIRTWFSSIDWAGLGRTMINGIVAGLQSAGQAIISTLMGFAQSAWSAVVDFFAGGGGSTKGTSRSSTRGAIIPSAVGVSSRGGATTRATVINIDARGAARGVDQDLRRTFEKLMREYGGRADVRMRTT